MLLVIRLRGGLKGQQEKQEQKGVIRPVSAVVCHCRLRMQVVYG